MSKEKLYSIVVRDGGDYKSLRDAALKHGDKYDVTVTLSRGCPTVTGTYDAIDGFLLECMFDDKSV